jgi:hypothetical protein
LKNIGIITFVAMKTKKHKFLPLTLSIETSGGIATPMIQRGTPLPTKRSKTFTTAEDNQKDIEIKILMGERPIANQNMSLTRFLLPDIPPKPKGEPQITVAFEVDEFCNITASAKNENNIEVKIEHKDTNLSLSESIISKALNDAEINRNEDEKFLIDSTTQLKAKHLISQAERYIQESQSFSMSNSELYTLENLLASLGLALYHNDYSDIINHCEKLEEELRVLRQIDHHNTNNLMNTFFGFSSEPKNVKKKTDKNQPQKNEVINVKTSKNTNDANLGKIFGDISWVQDPMLCFVLMPFSKPFNQIYTDHINPCVGSNGLRCLRADEILSTNPITKDIWEKIVQAKLIIADLTTQNPNVFYEVGLAHALGKDVIQLTQTMGDVPFDLKGFRCIVYEYTPPGIKILETKLKSTINQIVSVK